MGPSTRLLTIKGLSALLDVSEGTVYRMVGRGEIPVLKIGKGSKPTIRIDIAVFEHFMKTGRWR